MAKEGTALGTEAKGRQEVLPNQGTSGSFGEAQGQGKAAAAGFVPPNFVPTALNRHIPIPKTLQLQTGEDHTKRWKKSPLWEVLGPINVSYRLD